MKTALLRVEAASSTQRETLIEFWMLLIESSSFWQIRRSSGEIRASSSLAPDPPVAPSETTNEGVGTRVPNKTAAQSEHKMAIHCV